MQNESFDPFPYIPEVCPLIRGIMIFYCVVTKDSPLDDIPVNDFLVKVTPSGHRPADAVSNIDKMFVRTEGTHEKMVVLTNALGLHNLDIQLLSPGICTVRGFSFIDISFPTVFCTCDSVCNVLFIAGSFNMAIGCAHEAIINSTFLFT